MGYSISFVRQHRPWSWCRNVYKCDWLIRAMN